MNIKLESLHDSTDINYEVLNNEELENGKKEIEDLDIELEDLHHSIDIKEEISSNSSSPDQDHETEICELFACGVCNLIFTNEFLLEQHKKLHSVEQNFLCQICNRKFLSKTSLRKHLKVHPGVKPFACEICDFKSSREENLKIHLRTHTGVKSYGCKICNFKCSHSTSFKIHMKTHAGAKPFSCKVCDYESFLKDNFKTHLTTHNGVKPFKCKICKYKTSHVINLNNHIILKHAGEKRFDREVCDNETRATTSSSSSIYPGSSSYGNDNSDKSKRVPKDALAEGVLATINPIVQSFVPKPSIQIFAQFVGNQLEYLQSDENILLETQEEITKIIWKARRQACFKNAISPMQYGNCYSS